MKQQCYLVAIYLNWIVLLGGAGYFTYRGHYALALACLVFLPLGLWLYIRLFPFISKPMGYGVVDDKPAGEIRHAPIEVTLYAAAGCPFCPIVKRRLVTLREGMGFTLKEVDVTFRPGLLAAKGIRAVPVIEVADRRLQGNATSEQLAQLISGSAKTTAAAD